MGLINGLVATRWPGNCAPWTVDASRFFSPDLANITTAVAQLNATGLVRLIPRTTQTRFIDVVPDRVPLDGTCWSSHTGMSGGRQEVMLDTNASVGRIMHEFLHALGVSHEHKRPDRDSFVMINYADMQVARRGDFDKAAAPAAVNVGANDLDSIMHYGSARGASVDGDTRLITTIDPSNQSRIGQRTALSPGDLGSLQALEGGSVMVVGFDASGQIGSVIDLESWGEGFNLVAPFTIGPSTFLFLLKTEGGRMHIRDVAASGAIGAIRDNRDWSSDWTTALHYTRGPQACLLLYKKSTGLMRLHTLSAIGTVGPMIEEAPLPPSSGAVGTGWTSIKHYRIGTSDYLFFLRKSTGETMVHGVGSNGGLGQRIQVGDWSSDWTSAEPFTTPNGTFLFLLKAVDGTMHVNRIKTDGTIGAQLPPKDWSSGWTIARPFASGGRGYLFLLKSADGTVHVNRINDDGTIGAVIDERNFGPGWTSGAVLQRGQNAAMVLIRA
jgi:hypothetical protein